MRKANNKAVESESEFKFDIKKMCVTFIVKRQPAVDAANLSY